MTLIIPHVTLDYGYYNLSPPRPAEDHVCLYYSYIRVEKRARALAYLRFHYNKTYLYLLFYFINIKILIRSRSWKKKRERVEQRKNKTPRLHCLSYASSVYIRISRNSFSVRVSFRISRRWVRERPWRHGWRLAVTSHPPATRNLNFQPLLIITSCSIIQNKNNGAGRLLFRF